MDQSKDQINLGLPLEYQQMPEYFDAHNISKDTEQKNAVIEQLLRKENVHSVLDLTCGTGSQIFHLAKHSYQLTGADFSPDLLKIAREKAKQIGLNVEFIDGDMRTLKLGQFDAVITIFNAIGHLSTSDFEKALQNIHNNLKEGGVYIFDIFNLQVMTNNTVAGLAMDLTKTINGDQIHNIQHSTIDSENGLLTSFDNYTVSKKDGTTKSFKNNFTLQIYTQTQLNEILLRNSFDIIDQCGIDGAEFRENDTLNILTVARKIPPKRNLIQK